MQLIKDIFLVSADQHANKFIPINGEKFYVDTDFEPYEYATRSGTIEYTPHFIDKQYTYDVPLKKGDNVLMHHFVAQDDNIVTLDNQTYFKADYVHLFCKVEGDNLTCLEDFIFVEPIKETNEDLFVGNIQIKFDKENKYGIGVVRYLSNNALNFGLQKGDIIYHTKGATYKINALGKMFYRMRIRNILMVNRNGEYVCPKGMVIIKPVDGRNKWELHDKKEKFGQILSKNDELTELNVGDVVSYFNVINAPITINGEDFILVRRNEIFYVNETTWSANRK